MSDSDNVELHQLGNTLADVAQHIDLFRREVVELRRVMWAHLVHQCGSWETAGNCYFWGMQGADQVRKTMAKKGGDA